MQIYLNDKLNHNRSIECQSIKPKLNRIVIISGNAELTEYIQQALNHEGYRVRVFHDGIRGLLSVRRAEPDLVILDWSIPGISGLDICYRLRSTRSRIPIILLADGNKVSDRIAGLHAGADDCIAQPFIKEEFLARIQTQLRNSNVENSHILKFADMRLNRQTRNVFREDHFIELTAKEFDLLEYFMTHSYQVMTRDQILENIWGYDFMGDSNIIEVYVRYLRLKLEAHNPNRLIHTVRGVGYVLREPV